MTLAEWLDRWVHCRLYIPVWTRLLDGSVSVGPAARPGDAASTHARAK